MRVIYSYSNRGYSILRGVAALLIGIALISWPETAIRTLLLFLGCVFITTGVFSLTSILRMQGKSNTGSFLSINGMITILIGVLLVAFPDFFVNFVMFFFGGILVIIGGIQFFSLLSMPNGSVSPLQYVVPVLIFLSGVLIFVNPFKAAGTIFLFFGIITAFYGISELYNVWKFKKNRNRTSQYENNVQDAEIVE